MGLLALVFPLAALGMLTAFAVRRHDDALGRALALRRVGLGIVLVFATMVGVFMAGEALADPGGWAAVGMICAWTVPLGALTLFAWLRPEPAFRVLRLAAVALIALDTLTLIGVRSVQSFQLSYDPARDVAGVVIMAALGVVGYKLPGQAARLAVVTFALPLAVAVVAESTGDAVSLLLISLLPLVSSAYHLAAEHVLAAEGAEPEQVATGVAA
ncbi:MAG: hypothetical protein M0Z47_08980 [Actinomycetota bacterium]|nr:hypothetical protein [Actinomycetota bacterium]